MNGRINSEQGIQGFCWNAMHDGYFSDPAVAAPLVQKVRELASRSKPDEIIDLGGGTGSLLAQLLSAGIDPGVKLVDLDDSTTQLDAAKSPGFSCLLGDVDSFVRRDLGPETGRYLFMMRSVLHYFGSDGLRPALRHLHAQARQGEYFVHQTASFSRQEDADCLNDLYRMMRTQKWYPTVTFLRECLHKEGWHVQEVCPAPPLRLKHNDLMRRYSLDGTDVRRIRESLPAHPSVPDDVFTKTDSGFCAFLHYWIYVCTQVPKA